MLTNPDTKAVALYILAVIGFCTLLDVALAALAFWALSSVVFGGAFAAVWKADEARPVGERGIRRRTPELRTAGRLHKTLH